MKNLEGEIIIFKTLGIEPNYAALSREYGMDPRTILKKDRLISISTLNSYEKSVNSNNLYNQNIKTHVIMVNTGQGDKCGKNNLS